MLNRGDILLPNRADDPSAAVVAIDFFIGDRFLIATGGLIDSIRKRERRLPFLNEPTAFSKRSEIRTGSTFHWDFLFFCCFSADLSCSKGSSVNSKLG